MTTRLSFSARLVLVAFLAAVAPIAVAYVAMLDLPRRVAADALELSIRQESQEIIERLTEQRLQLREQVASLSRSDEFANAVARQDAPAIRSLIGEQTHQTVRVRFLHPAQDTPDVGPVFAVVRTIDDRTGLVRRAVISEPIAGPFLDELKGELAPVAMTHKGQIIAHSTDFPHGLKRGRYATPELDTESVMEQVRLGDRVVHVYSRPIGLDPAYHLAVVSTPLLEQRAVSEPRRDVARSIGLLALATAVFALAGGIAVNRSLRRFADRTHSLAQGNYGERLPVHGRDTFAELAGNFNLLAAELEHRISQLEQAAADFEETLETIDEGICVWSPDGHVEFWNRGAESLTGVARSRLHAEGTLRSRLREERSPGTRRVRLPVARPGGQLVADLTVTPMAGGGVLQTFRDVTTVELLHQTRRNFMATAAHELRTPLTTILGFSQTLTDPEVPLDESQRTEFLSLIHEQAQHLQRLTDAFFTNHQLANERVEVSVGDVALHEAVTSGIAKADLQPRDAMAGSPQVAVDVDPSISVRADARALSGVIALLVDNARKYGREPIIVSAELIEDVALLRVHDAGGAISHEHLDRIFDPFYRVDVDMRSGVGGAGLGLFTARKLVSAMRGSISVDSSAERGTTFTIELPRAGSVGDAVQTAQRDRAQGTV